MSKTPCEKAKYTIIPKIRKELATCLIENHNLTQIKTAEKLGITPAAISQYRNNRRGNNKIFPEVIMIEINYSAKLIYQKGSIIVDTEICRLCKIIRSNEGYMKSINAF